MSTVLVTGATSGVGRAIALRMAEDGHRVLALGRDRTRLDALAAEAELVPLQLDLTDRTGLGARIAHEEIDVLVNNAGLMPPLAPFHESDPAGLDEVVAINLTAQLALTRMVVPGMVARGRGHVVFTGSTAGHAPFANLAVYCATKAALGGFAQALRLDLAAHGVRVTEIVAGRVETDLYRKILSDQQRAAMYADGLAVQPEDVAEMLVRVLALPESVDVARFDILPTRQSVPSGQKQ